MTYFHNLWRAVRFGAVALLALSLIACAGPGPRRGAPPGPGVNAEGEESPGPGSGREFLQQALALKESEGCDWALPLLRRLAAYGGGYEVAQFHLGDCLVKKAQKAETGSEEWDVLAAEAMATLLKAATSGDANAQGALADIYFSGELVRKDNVEAAKWLLLYRDNPIRRSLGARSLPDGLEREMHTALSEEEWETARSLADRFVVVRQEIADPELERPDRAPGEGPVAGDERPPRSERDDNLPDANG